MDLFKATTQEDILYTWGLDFFNQESKARVKQYIETLHDSDIKILESNESIVTLNNKILDVKLTLVPIVFERIQAALVFVREIK